MYSIIKHLHYWTEIIFFIWGGDKHFFWGRKYIYFTYKFTNNYISFLINLGSRHADAGIKLYLAARGLFLSRVAHDKEKCEIYRSIERKERKEESFRSEAKLDQATENIWETAI